MPNCCVHKLFEEGGVTWAAAIATWAWVCMRGVGLVEIPALQSHAACHFWMRSRLDELAGKAVGLMPGTQPGLPVGLLVVSRNVALMGFPVGLLVGTLRTGDCGCMEHVICLSSLIWDFGALSGVCTLWTCCVLWVSSGVVVSSNFWGCASKWACVASIIRCRPCVAWEVLALPVIPWMAMTQSANAWITLSVCVMEGLVILLCWNWTVLDSHSLLVCLVW